MTAKLRWLKAAMVELQGSIDVGRYAGPALGYARLELATLTDEYNAEWLRLAVQGTLISQTCTECGDGIPGSDR